MPTQGVDDPFGAPALDEVTLSIDNEDFRFWETIELSLAMDKFSTATFNAPFEAEREAFREIFRPFTYKDCEISIGGDPSFTGTMVGISPDITAEARRVSVDCYALPGVLGDVMLPKSAWPTAFEKVDLRQIAETVLAPFGLALEFAAEPGAQFKEVKLEEAKTVLSFLIELAQQRNLVITNDALGFVVFQQSIATGSPVAQFLFDAGGKDPRDPLPRVTSNFSPQAYYSEITGMGPTKKGRKGSAHTIQNKFLDKLRPHAFKLDDTEAGDVPTMTEAKMGRMFGNMATYTIENIPSWRDPQGDLWTPNTTLNLRSPDAMIYNTTEFLIREVKLTATAESQTASLGLVLPGAFSGEQPDRMPWDE